MKTDVFDNSDLVFYLVSACLPICSAVFLYAVLILNFTCFHSLDNSGVL